MHENHRNRLLSKVLNDISVLEQHEILEALLFYAIPRKDTNTLAKELISACGTSITDVFQADTSILLSVKGIGKSTVAYIKLLGTVFEEFCYVNNKPLRFNSFGDAKDILVHYFKGQKTESLYAFMLDSTDHVVCQYCFYDNERSKVQFDLTEFNSLLTSIHPTSVLLAHNHPSGFALPSPADDESTRMIYLLLNMNKVNLSDHIIVSGVEAYSYFVEGKLEEIKSHNF